VRVASVEMARAVRVMTVERGVDPRPLALVAFGGAGPLHAAAIADELGMRRVVVPRSSGVLSALGLVVSERRRDLAESTLLSGERLTVEAVAETVDRLSERGRSELRAPEAEVRCAYDLRYAGQGFELTVAGPPGAEPKDLREDFDEAHDDRYGYSDPDAELELVTVRVAVAEPGPALAALSEGHGEPDDRATRRPAVFEGEATDAAVIRDCGGELVDGPAIVELPEATLLVPPGWTAAEDRRDRTIVMERG
jgi:N-methylhydantoinase A